MDASTTDVILTELKPFGRIQVAFLVCSAGLQFFLPMTGQSINFLGATPNHHCSLRDGYYLNQSIPLEENKLGREVYSRCQEYIDPENSNLTQDCQNGWEFLHDVYGETIISEWNLACDGNAAAVVEISQSVLQAGGLIGSLLFGMLADRYGRKPTFLIAMIIYCLSGTLLCFSVNYIMFVILRFFCGFGQMAAFVPMATNISEYMIPKYRNRAMNVPTISTSFGLMFMALLAYLIPDWRFLQLAIVTPAIIGLIAMWFLPESLRWYLMKGKYRKAERLVKKLAKINKADLPEKIDSKTSSQANQIFAISNHSVIQKDIKRSENDIANGAKNFEAENNLPDCEKNGSEKVITEKDLKRRKTETKLQPQKKNYLHLFKPPVLIITFVLSISRFSYALIYFGFALSTGRLAGNPYLNFFYSALVEVPASLLLPIVYRKFRRTYIVGFCYTVCGIGLIVTIFIPSETKNGVDLSVLVIVLSLMGKFFVVLSRGGNMLLSVELFPTSVRNMGNGFTLCMGRVGAVIAPFMLYMDNVIPSFSIVLMAIMSMITALCVLSLPDTRKTAQPQDTNDLREILKTRLRWIKRGSGQDNTAFEGDT